MRQDSPVPPPLDAAVRRRLVLYARLPERVVLCIDVSPEMGQPWSSSPPPRTRLDIVKQTLNAFLHYKSLFHPRHEFALATVDEQGSRVVLPFTSTLADVFRTLDCIAPVGPWPLTAAPAADKSGLDLAHLLGNTLPSLLSKYIKIDGWNKDNSNHKSSSSSSHPALARAILFMGASYAFPHLPEPRVIKALFANDRFFFDFIYIHARKASLALPPSLPPPPSSSSIATEVKLLDLEKDDDDDDVVAIVDPPPAQTLLPSLPPPPLLRRSNEIMEACLELFMNRHPWLQQAGYCFSVPHGCDPAKVTMPLQLLLAHPAQRLPQAVARERLNYWQGQGQGQRESRRRGTKGLEREREGGRVEVTTPAPREGGGGVGGTRS